MTRDSIRELFVYSDWAHRKVWECIVGLTDEQYHQPSDYSIGSVHAQVVHTLGAEWVWLQRMNGVSPAAFPDPADFPTRESVRARWDAVTSDWFAYLDGLRDDQLAQPLHYVSLNGSSARETVLWLALVHLVNHATDHRAQTLAQIHRVGGQTLAQDLIFYDWQRRSAPS